MVRLLVIILLLAKVAIADGWTYCLPMASNMGFLKESTDLNAELVGLRVGRTIGAWEFYTDVLNAGFGFTIHQDKDSTLSYDGGEWYVDEMPHLRASLVWVPEIGVSYSLMRMDNPTPRPSSDKRVDALSLQAGYSLQSYLSTKEYFAYPYIGIRVLLYNWGVDWSSWRDPKISESRFYMGLRVNPIEWNRFTFFCDIPLHFRSTTYTKL